MYKKLDDYTIKQNKHIFMTNQQFILINQFKLYNLITNIIFFINANSIKQKQN